MRNMQWVERLSTVLSERGLTQDQFARRIGKSQASVSRWMTGVSFPRVDAERRIANELGISWQWLMTGEGEKEQKRIFEDKGSASAAAKAPSRRLLWRYEENRGAGLNDTPSDEDLRIREMLVSIRLLIGDHTDSQIVARVHETLDDQNFSMQHRLMLVQALLDELYHRYRPPGTPAT